MSRPKFKRGMITESIEILVWLRSRLRPLKFVRRLKEVGVSEAQVEPMAEAFVFNMDSLVTKYYLEQFLDASFATFESRLTARFEARVAALLWG